MKMQARVSKMTVISVTFTILVSVLASAQSTTPNVSGVVELLELAGHQGEVYSVQFNQDSTAIFSASADGTIRIWDTKTGRVSKLHRDEKVTRVFISNDFKYLISSFRAERIISLFDLASEKLFKSFSLDCGGSEPYQAYLYKSQKSILVNCAGFKIINVATGKIESIPNTSRFGDRFFSVSPDEKTLAVIDEAVLNLIDLPSFNEFKVLKNHTSYINHVDFSPDSRQIVTASSDETFKTWNILTGKVILDGRRKDRILFAKFSPDGKLIATGGEDQPITLWDAITGDKLTELTGQKSVVTALDFSQDGRFLASGDNSGIIKIWGVPSGASTFGKPGSITASSSPALPSALPVFGASSVSSNSIPSQKPEPFVSSTPEPTPASVVAKPAVQPSSSSVAPVSTQPRSGVRALVIGINSYSSDRIPEVKYAESDARKFVDALVNPRVGNFAKANVNVLLGTKATKSAIERGVKNLAGQTKSGEALVVYFAGHGAPSPQAQAEALLVPWDADPEDLVASSVQLEQLTTASTGAGNLVFVLDSCFSGQRGSRGIVQVGARPFGVRVQSPGLAANVSVFSAASDDQISLESGSLDGGLFTHFVLDGLTGLADVNRDGTVTLEEAAKYAQAKVSEEAKRLNASQTPSLLGGGSFALAQNAESQVLARAEMRVGKLSALLATASITPKQFELLVELVRSSREPPILRDYLDGTVSEGTFLTALQAGAIPGVPKS